MRFITSVDLQLDWAKPGGLWELVSVVTCGRSHLRLAETAVAEGAGLARKLGDGVPGPPRRAQTANISLRPQIMEPGLTSGGRREGAGAPPLPLGATAGADKSSAQRLWRHVQLILDVGERCVALSRRAKTSVTKRNRVNRRFINLPSFRSLMGSFVRKRRVAATRLLKCEKGLISVSLRKQADAKFDQTLQAESGSLAPLSTVSTSRAVHGRRIGDVRNEK